MTDDLDVLYPCLGICTADEQSGLCLGCGRPLAAPQADARPESAAGGDLLQAAVDVGERQAEAEFPVERGK